MKRGCERRRPVGWQCAPEFVGLEGEEGRREEEGRRGETERKRGEESEAGESTVCNFAKETPYTHASLLTVQLLSPLTCELCCPAQVVHKVSPTMGSVTSFPAVRQGPQFMRIKFHIPKPRVMPCAHSSSSVDEVDLPLRCSALLCRCQDGEKHIQ